MKSAWPHMKWVCTGQAQAILLDCFDMRRNDIDHRDILTARAQMRADDAADGACADDQNGRSGHGSEFRIECHRHMGPTTMRAAPNIEDRSSNPLGAIGGKERHCIGDILGPTGAAERDAGQRHVDVVVLVGRLM